MNAMNKNITMQIYPAPVFSYEKTGAGWRFIKFIKIH